MVDDMIERVARKILEAQTDWLFGKDAKEDLFLTMARAAIEAMREPTEAMVNGLRITRECDSTAALWAPHIWRTMIDEALGDKP